MGPGGSPRGVTGVSAGDDDHVYFVHFSDIVTDKPVYRELQKGQRVEFEWRGGRAAHDRKPANNVRSI